MKKGILNHVPANWNVSVAVPLKWCLVKAQTKAEKLLLSVERTKKGYSLTKETKEFKDMLKEFKPEKDVFNIFQNQKEKGKVGSRLKLYMCDCGVKIRCAIELNAKCLDCEGDFKLIV